MLTDFIEKKMKDARYRKLSDGAYFGEIVGVKGVWAEADNLEECRAELQEVLEEWLLLKIRNGERVKGLHIPKDKHYIKSHSNA